LTPAVIWDLRDNPFNPTKGSLHGVSVKEAMKTLGSEADFTKATVQTSWYLPLGDRLLGALSARAGMAWPHWDTDEIPLNERFKLGGGNTVRGYLQDMVGPTSTDPVTGNLVPTGGDSMVLFNGELRINPSGGLGLVLFTDAGNVWTGREINLDDLRASYGAGIRFNTPVGPLRLDYGQKIHRRAGESPGQIHFSIGQAF
jgi:outer membrane protein assembly factor BamA